MRFFAYSVILRAYHLNNSQNPLLSKLAEMGFHSFLIARLVTIIASEAVNDVLCVGNLGPPIFDVFFMDSEDILSTEVKRHRRLASLAVYIHG